MPDAEPQAAMTRFQDAPTRTISVGGSDFADRDLMVGSSPPLVMLNHCGENLGDFALRIIDGLATGRRMVALNYRGVGRSKEMPPLTISETACDVIAVIHALNLGVIDLLESSFGGFVAQDIVLCVPSLVRKVILTGTGARGRCRYTQGRGRFRAADPKGHVQVRRSEDLSVLHPDRECRCAAKAFLRRLKERGCRAWNLPVSCRTQTAVNFLDR